MKNKTGKVLTLIIVLLLVAIGVALFVTYIVNKELALSIIETVKDFVNRPLPIIGITTGAVLIFIWRLVVSTNFGKTKLAEYDAERKKLREEHDAFVKDANAKIEELENKNKELANDNAELKGLLVEVCSLSTNKKINDFGKALDNYGKETTDTETKAD